MANKKIAILTGGGDCPGLNPAIRGVVLKAHKLGYDCLGIQEGWKGMINGTAKPIGPDDVREMVGRGGTMLGTSRTNPYKKEGGVQGVLNSFKKLDLHALVAMDDTLDRPGLQPRRQLLVKIRHVAFEKLERAPGEHHAETESRVRRVLLEDLHAPSRKAPLDQQRE
jgi:hypothetical protein